MAINERLIDTEVAAANGGNGGAGTGNQEEGLILHLDANDVDSYDGDGDEWVDIANHEYTPSTDVSEHFNTVTWTGDDAADREITGVGFTPDLVWIKNRDTNDSHQLYDSLRGNYGLYSNGTDAQFSQTNWDIIDDGFDLGAANDGRNETGKKIVAWCFKAGGAPSGSDKVSIDGNSYANEAAAGLTAGTIAVDKLSANTKLGFSAVKVVDHNNTKTIAHGLGVTPELIIQKVLDSGSYNWYVYHKDLGNGKYLNLNTNGSASSDNFWDYTSPTSSVFTHKFSGTSFDMMYYCFASKRGVSKVGSYVGTGASNKVTTGFEPAFVMVKRTNSTGNWMIHDNKRSDNDGDGQDLVLYADLYNDEDEYSTAGHGLVFNRDGFTINATGADTNASGSSYIYYAVAKSTNETGLTPNKDDFTAGSVETTDLEVDLRANGYAGSGAWQDSSGNANHATLTAVTHTDNGDEDYFTSNGTTTEISVPLTLSTVGVATTEFWVKGSSLTSPTATDILFTKADGWFFTIFANANSLVFRTSNAANSVQSDVSYPLSNFNSNDWYHIAVTLSGASNPMKMYVNGEKVAEGTSQPTFRALSLYNSIMADVNSDTFTWNGSLAQFRTYSSTLTPAQIESNYEATRIYNAPDLQLHLDAGDDSSYSGSGSTWSDLVNSNDVTLTSTTYDAELGDFLNFTGGTSKALINNSAALTNVSDLTIDMWVNTLDNNSYRYLFGNMDTLGTNTRQMYAYVDSSDRLEVTLYYNNTSSGYRLSRTNSVASKLHNKWAHISVVISSGLLSKIYIDGEEEPITYTTGSAIAMHTGSTSKFNVGSANQEAQHSFHGAIGQFRLYHSALSQADIRQNFNFTKPNYPNGYDGTLGGLTGADWNSNGYFTFDGSNDYIQTAYKGLHSEFTLRIKFNVPDFTSGRLLFTTSDSYLLQEGIYVYILSDAKINVSFSNGSSKVYEQASATNSLTSGTVHDFVLTQSSDGVKAFYLDGNLINSSTGQVVDSSYNPFKIGSYTAYTNDRFKGDMHLVKIYDRALTSTEIAAL
jgi:hypothetical protein